MSNEPARIRRRFELRGQVQGVGFRPYVYRTALVHNLGGFVANDSTGAQIEVEGGTDALAAFERDLLAHLPPLAHISHVTRRDLPAAATTTFRIHPSQQDTTRRPEVTPDAATCADCLREMWDPQDRRYRYPFINCTNCGPRYSIIRTVPYDRPHTTMAAFSQCPACAREYADPADRRFHAQPNACPVCGPRVTLSDRDAADSIAAAAALIRDGAILAVKGLGGYHLACRADDEAVVQRLRRRKLRDGKPLAVMVPDVATARALCALRPADVDALQSTAAPIVLAPARTDHGLAPAVAPGCADLGLMLPYTPLHHLLLAACGGPLVMTSANLSGQPLTYRDGDAQRDLGDVADAFLTHDREIFRPIDDSVVFTFRDEVVPLRRARGYAPRPLRVAGFGVGEPLAAAAERRILAVGGELKSTVCLLHRGEAVISEHLGDLSNAAAFRHFVDAIERLKDLCGFKPDVVACDLHPRYLSAAYARELGLPLVQVQHHHAHVVGVMAEWGELGPVVGLACDGTGYGTDGAIWGCEVLVCEGGDFERAGHLAYFPLVGGDRAAVETWRPAGALLQAAIGDTWPATLVEAAGAAVAPAPAALRLFEQQRAAGVNVASTSSLGRCFDAVSCLLGLCGENRHEAEAAMELEAAARRVAEPVAPLPFAISDRGAGLRLSLVPAVREIVAARRREEPVEVLASRFHETVAHMLAEAGLRTCRARGIDKVALTGGCFANRRLLQRLCAMLEANGLRVLYHRHLPCGDGGIALGQALVAAWRDEAPAAAS